MQQLSIREEQVLSHFAIGLSAKEIADQLGMAFNTANKTIANIKIKLGFDKGTELTAYWWCRLLEADYTEVKKKVLASITLVLLLMYTITANDSMMRRGQRIRMRRNEYEYVIAS